MTVGSRAVGMCKTAKVGEQWVIRVLNGHLQLGVLVRSRHPLQPLVAGLPHLALVGRRGTSLQAVDRYVDQAQLRLEPLDVTPDGGIAPGQRGRHALVEALDLVVGARAGGHDALVHVPLLVAEARQAAQLVAAARPGPDVRRFEVAVDHVAEPTVLVGQPLRQQLEGGDDVGQRHESQRRQHLGQHLVVVACLVLLQRLLVLLDVTA